MLILGALFRSLVPLAYWQVAAIIGKREVVVSPRFARLEEAPMGYVRRVVKEKNPNTNALCWTWELTDRGRAVATANHA